MEEIVINPYKNLYHQAMTWCTELMPPVGAKQFIDSQIRGDLVESVNLSVLQQYTTYTYFHHSRHIFGFVTPTLEWARAVKKVIGDASVLEVAAGTGLVAKYLDAVGIKIIATDNYSWHNNHFSEWRQYFNVENLDFKEAIKKYKTDILLLCWPMYDDPLAKEAAELFTQLNPDGKIFYIGEEIEGCTADDEFHNSTEIIDELVEVNAVYPQWSGLYDKCFLLKW